MKGRPSADYTVCPDCGKRKVLFHFGRGGDDYLECSACKWSVFRWPPHDNVDGPRIEAWCARNGVIE
jgi:ssDNA-binding Zn-finger/Zn-ribbon topoisomerase 1